MKRTQTSSAAAPASIVQCKQCSMPVAQIDGRCKSQCVDCHEPLCMTCAYVLDLDDCDIASEQCFTCLESSIRDEIREQRAEIDHLLRKVQKCQMALGSITSWTENATCLRVGERVRGDVARAAECDTDVLRSVDSFARLVECLNSVYRDTQEDGVDDIGVAELKIKNVVQHADPWGKETQQDRTYITRKLKAIAGDVSALLPLEMRVAQATWREWTKKRRFPRPE